MSQLEWAKLLSDKRERPSSRKKGEKYVARNEFEADYDRIVGSSSVRRLQDKAQVFPLQEGDVARTRLTHSIEVSAMARSMGKAVGRELEKKYPDEFISENTEQLASLLQVAGLIHDLGNPPFGHYGETVIQDWFSTWFKEERDGFPSTYLGGLTEQEKNDFLYFDGNVQNIRIVSKLQIQNDTYGANFTYATLGTIMKYPWRSNQTPEGKRKFGYFKSEEELANDVRATLGLADKVRHPATYLLEAADDIIYLCDDIEDGVKKGHINWQSELNKIEEHFQDESELKKLLEQTKQKNIDARMSVQEKITASVRNFRNIVQSHLFKRCVGEFVDHYKDIMSNVPLPDYELLKCEDRLIRELKRVTQDNCFVCHEVLALELEGHKVISTLLDVFVNSLVKHSGNELMDTRTYCGKIFALISPNFVFRTLHGHATSEEIIAESKAQISCPTSYIIEKLNKLSLYDRLHLATDFISGMTDSYAVQVYQELMGIRHP